MDAAKKGPLFYCPICRDGEAHLFEGSKSELWFCGRCMHAFWKVTNLLGEEIFLLHTQKIRYWFTKNYQVGAKDPNECPF